MINKVKIGDQIFMDVTSEPEQVLLDRLHPNVIALLRTNLICQVIVLLAYHRGERIELDQIEQMLGNSNTGTW